jgi:outer membrane receptor protein involved in Fe transport
VLNAGQKKEDLINPAGGLPPETVPEFTTNLGVQWTQPAFHDWDIVARGDWGFQGHFPQPIRGALYYVHAVNIVDLQLGLKNPTWGVRAFAKNVLNDRYMTELADQFAFFSREYNKPRSYGFEFSYRF